MAQLEMTMINVFVCLGVLHRPPHQRHRAICEAALPPSSCHLWAAGRSGSVSQLSVPPPQSGARLFDACSCLSHPGENHLDRNKMKSLYLTLWRPFNRVVMHCYSLFHAEFARWQLVRWTNAINTSYYIILYEAGTTSAACIFLWKLDLSERGFKNSCKSVSTAASHKTFI